MVIRVSTIFDYKVVVTLIIVLVVCTCNALVIGNKIVAQCTIYTIFAPHFDRLCTIILGITREPMQKHSISCNMSKVRLTRLRVIHLTTLKGIQMTMQSIKIAPMCVICGFPILRSIFFCAHGKNLC